MTRRSLKGRKNKKGRGGSRPKSKRTQKRGGMIRALTNMYNAYRNPETVPDKVYQNGDKYYGALENDLPNGHGILKKKTFQQEYEGDWVNGELHQGIVRMYPNTVNMRTYQGGLIQNMDVFEMNGSVLLYPHGEGTMEYANGNRYVGNWEQMHPSGQGTMTFSNGDVYTGNFLGGEQHGTGTMRYADGTEWTGRWEHGNKTRLQLFKRER